MCTNTNVIAKNVTNARINGSTKEIAKENKYFSTRQDIFYRNIALISTITIGRRYRNS